MSQRSLLGELGNPLQYSCLGIPKAREDWWAYRSLGDNELETTEQLISNRVTFLTETLKIPEMHEKILSLDKVKENA